MSEPPHHPSDRSARRLPWGLARVHGRSMGPGLRPGDRLLVSYRRRPVPGSLVVARFPDGSVVLKRATERRRDRRDRPGWWLVSDDPSVGVDSRHRGVVPEEEVFAVVLARVWPRPRGLLVRGSAGGQRVR